MEMTQRGRLSEADRERIAEWQRIARRAEAQLAEFRGVMVDTVARSSFREVSDATGISTTTLQRWKREAGK